MSRTDRHSLERPGSPRWVALDGFGLLIPTHTCDLTDSLSPFSLSCKACFCGLMGLGSYRWVFAVTNRVESLMTSAWKLGHQWRDNDDVELNQGDTLNWKKKRQHLFRCMEVKKWYTTWLVYKCVLNTVCGSDDFQMMWRTDGVLNELKCFQMCIYMLCSFYCMN